MHRNRLVVSKQIQPVAHRSSVYPRCAPDTDDGRGNPEAAGYVTDDGLVSYLGKRIRSERVNPQRVRLRNQRVASGRLVDRDTGGEDKTLGLTEVSHHPSGRLGIGIKRVRPRTW